MVLVQDMDRAMRFYRDALGLTVDQEEEDFATFAEGVGLMLAPEPIADELLNMNSVVISLHVDSVQDAFHELTQKGIPFFIAPTDAGGFTIASLRDSEGNILQLVQY